MRIDIVEVFEVSGVLQIMVESDAVPEFQRVEEFVGEHTTVCEQQYP